MPVQKPVFGWIAKDPEAESIVIFDPVIISRGPARVVSAPPFSSETLRPFRTGDTMLLLSNEKLHRRFAWNENGNFNADGRI